MSLHRELLLLLVALTGCASSRDPIASGENGECARCHLAEFASARKHSGVKPTTCAVCHTQEGWHPTVLEHDQWPLTGAHVKTACLKCHQGNPPKFHGTAQKCYDCHREDYEGAKRHEKFAKTCADCHTTKAWKPTNKSKKNKTEEPEPKPTTTKVVEPPPSATAPTSKPTTNPTTKPTTKPTSYPTTKPTTKPTGPDVVTGATK